MPAHARPDDSDIPQQQSEESQTAEANRRLFDRHAVNRACRVTELDQLGNPGASWECRIVDLSRSGLGLRSRRMAYQGRHILVEIPAATDRPAKVLFGVIRQSRYSEGEGYAIGVEFRAMPQSTVVRNWLSQRGLQT
jgi:hypothetical protein